MQIEPIINARFKQFRLKNSLENEKDSVAFEKFVNYTIYTLYHPDAFSADSELLEFVSVGGPEDMGIDGIAIKVNDIIIKHRDDISDILKYNSKKQIDVEFIFIQSKFKTNYDKGELNNFVDGVRDFLGDSHNFPMNEEIQKHLKLKEHLLSDELVLMWENNPRVTMYYVALGRWQNPADLVGIQKQFEQDIDRMNVYDKVKFNFIDSEGLRDIYDSIQNTFSTTIDTRHIMPLTEVNNVNNSCLSIVYATELLKLISTSDGIIRKSLFNDNVRDFQGTNPVNTEIYNTIQTKPENFIILNNGITIVCDDFKQNNTKISITNPQIVNGCQTSHIIYEAYKAGLNIDTVPVSIKFISTTDEDIVNDIVRGTNRQNIVFEEAFETTKKFHKDLEELFKALSNDYATIYYERRSKQYLNNPTIKQTEKVNLKNLTQYFIGMFLNEPHASHRHESVLLKEFSDKIFLDYHSKLPYFVTAYSFISFEKFLRENKTDKYIKTYKPHILMMFRQSISGYMPSLSKENIVDKHCNLILEYLKDENKFKIKINEIIEIFKKAMLKWTSELGKSQRGTKDVEAFTKHLLSETNSYYKLSNEVLEKKQLKFVGQVLNVIKDRYGNHCGFISKEPSDIFFHSGDNPNIDFYNLKQKSVIYEILPTPKENLKVKAKILTVI